MSFVDPARPASLRSTQVLGAFRLFPIANRDNRSFTDVSQCHARNTEDLVARVIWPRLSLYKCTSGLRSSYSPYGPCISLYLSPAARLAALARLTTFDVDASCNSCSSHTFLYCADTGRLSIQLLQSQIPRGVPSGHCSKKRKHQPRFQQSMQSVIRVVCRFITGPCYDAFPPLILVQDIPRYMFANQR